MGHAPTVDRRHLDPQAPMGVVHLLGDDFVRVSAHVGRDALEVPVQAQRLADAGV
jgi:hypothetical protein